MYRVIAAVSLSLLAVPALALSEAPRKVELSENWKLASTTDVQADGAAISSPGYRDGRWHPIHRMPATVLEILQEGGIYPNLYVGKDLLEKAPQDLWKQDWWYRTVFIVPAGYSTYTLDFAGINYRAEVWMNGRRVADTNQIVGLYAAHDLNVTERIKAGAPNWDWP